MDPQLEPTFGQFGAAVYDAQVLEAGLRLLLALVASHKQISLSGPSRYPIDGENQERNLGALFKAAKAKEHFTAAEEKLLWDAIRRRNDLTHEFLVVRTRKMGSDQGRRELLAELSEYRIALQRAGQIVDDLIDKYLSEYNTSIDQLKEEAAAFWEAASEIESGKTH